MMASNVDDLSGCLSDSPLLQNIIALFEQCIVSSLPRMNEAEIMPDRTSKIREFENSLRDLKTQGTKSDREQFFRYLLPFYLKGDISPIARKYQNSDRTSSPPNQMKPSFQKAKSQTALVISGGFRNRSSISISSKPTIDPSNFRKISEDALIKKTFLTMNFYSAAYVPIFIEVVQKMMAEEPNLGQTTLNRFVEENGSRVLQTPFAQRVLFYINKSGEYFLDGVSNLPENTKILLETRLSPSLLKSFLQAYLETDSGRQIFPKWFGVLANSTQDEVVKNLLSKLP